MTDLVFAATVNFISDLHYLTVSISNDVVKFIGFVRDWSFWEAFQLSPAQEVKSGSIFGLAEYLASLALFLVVLTTSDFRFTYRLSLTRYNLKRIGLWISLGIGIALLLTDVWFENALPVPKFVSNSNNIKAFLGGIYLTYVFIVISTIIHPIKFSNKNAKQFFTINYFYIHQGNPQRLQTIAEELGFSVEAIFKCASTCRNEKKDQERTEEQNSAINLILLVADERFCKVIADSVPNFAIACIREAQKYLPYRFPIFQFTRNIGQAFIRNTDSAFYQEDNGYYSGLVGYAKPTTNTIFGSYDFIEACAANGASSLETDYSEFTNFKGKQLRGYSRAALAFLQSYLSSTRGGPHHHSYALHRMIDSFKNTLSGVYKMDGQKDYSGSIPYQQLAATIDFIRDALELVEKYAEPPISFRANESRDRDIYDVFAKLMFQAILAASSVTTPQWTAWAIQHNTVWDIFTFSHSKTQKIIAFKVRRLLYDEIKKMDSYANFKGARILGYCLHVLGLKLTDRHTGYQKEFYPLQAAAIHWVKNNYKNLLTDHPKVAKACLQGSITYDREKHCLVQTYDNDTGKAPQHITLALI